MAQLNYEQASAGYDLARELPLKDLVAWHASMRPYMEFDDMTVLDLGAGTGLFSRAFVEWFGASVVAVEPSSGMLETAIQKRSHERIFYIQGDAEHIPVPDGHFDVAWLSTVVHHFSDLSAAALEVRRVLKSNAPLLIRSCFPERSDNISLFRFFPEARRALNQFPTLAQVENTFSAAGFHLEHVDDIPQVTAPNLGVYRNRFVDDIRHTDTTLSNLSDDAYARGVARLEGALSLRSSGEPVVDYLTLAVFR